MEAQLACQGRVHAFDTLMRNYHYGYLVIDKPFGAAAYNKVTKHERSELYGDQ